MSSPCVFARSATARPSFASASRSPSSATPETCASTRAAVSLSSFGAGFAMKNGFVEAMYYMSRKDSDIFDNDIPQFRVNSAFRARALTIGAGVRF